MVSRKPYNIEFEIVCRDWNIEHRVQIHMSNHIVIEMIDMRSVFIVYRVHNLYPEIGYRPYVYLY